MRIGRLTRAALFCANTIVGELFDIPPWDGLTRSITGMLMTLGRAGIRFVFSTGLRVAVCVTLSTAIAQVNPTRADDTTGRPAADDFFESKVRPVLIEHCFQCHSAGAKSLKGGLRLDSFAAMHKGATPARRWCQAMSRPACSSRRSSIMTMSCACLPRGSSRTPRSGRWPSG